MKVPEIPSSINVINGTSGDDYIKDTSGGDVIWAGAGSDTIVDRYGSDFTFAGSGNDRWYYDWQHYYDDDVTIAYLEDGNDIAYMNFVDNQPPVFLHGGDGFDTLVLDASNINNGSKIVDFRTASTVKIGAVTVTGFERYIVDDTFIIKTVYFNNNGGYFDGYDSGNVVYGGSGDDYFLTGTFNNRLYGGAGNDILVARGGNAESSHHVFGGSGDDLIFANLVWADYSSHSQLTGDEGRDGFVLGYVNGKGEEDYIKDFNPAEDWIGIFNVKEFLSSPDAAVTQPISTKKYNIIDNVTELSFDSKDVSGLKEMHVRYDKVTGGIYINRDLSDPNGVEVLVLVLEGRPDLDPDHFYAMSQQYGSIYDDVLHGNRANDVLSGGLGSDTIYGLEGDDTLYGDIEQTQLPSGNDKLYGGKGNDAIYGEDGNDRLYGESGNDYLDGGAGMDVLNGGGGNDVYALDIGSDTIVDSAGRDTIISSITRSLASYRQIENLTLSGSGNISGTGNELANVITGNAGSNVLDGGAGSDHLYGGDGNDTYLLGEESDKITDTSGIDTITTTVDRQIAQYTTIENLTLLGTANINGAGNDLSNVIKGNSGKNALFGGKGNDTLDGGAGADVLDGGVGDDIYVLGNQNDNVIDVSGKDTITSTKTRSLAAYAAIENLILLGTGDLNGAGNKLDNVITGNLGDNLLQGDAGNDTLFGGAGADRLDGGAGNDTFLLGSDNDTVVDSSGIDTITTTISRSLDGYGAIENLTLEGSGDLRATGNDLDNVLKGNAGDNVLDGKRGNDRLEGGAGNDTYVLGAGYDIVSDSSGIDTITSTVNRNLADYDNLENLTLLGSRDLNGTGDNFNNNLVGNLGRNVLLGGGGDDRLDGRSGNDTLDGGTGNDIYVLDADNDEIIDLSGNDTIQSSVSRSLLDYQHIENLTLVGSSDANGTGNGQDNVLIGNAGINILNGGAGNDTLDGKSGQDTLKGGSGDDTYVLGAESDKVIDLDGRDTLTSTISRSLHDFNAIENITLVGTGRVDATGNSGDNVLIGNDGNNSLYGGDGDDILDGGASRDYLFGGAGNDTYIYGLGDDITDTSGNDTIVGSGPSGLIKLEWWSGIENLVLSDIRSTAGFGTDVDNIIIGNIGSDMLVGAGGVDTLKGNDGDDILDGGLGADKLVGGNGSDTAWYAGSSKGVTVFLGNPAQNTNEAMGDTYDSVENLSGSTFRDRLEGDDGSNKIAGNGGDDTLKGGAGNDVLIGGSGADKLFGDAGSDTASYKESAGRVVANLTSNQNNINDAMGDSYSSIENLTGSNYDDILIGDVGANVLDGGAGNDLLVGSAGADTLIGGGGIDTVSYEDATKGVAASLADAAQNTNDAKGDTYSDIENLTGSGYADILKGDDKANSILGGAGGDKLSGGLGYDVLSGGLGRDSFVFDTELGQTNIDTVVDFSVGSDRIVLDQDIFTSITNIGLLSSDAFHIGAQSHDADDRILYDDLTGRLLYDVDGTGGHEAVQFSFLSSGLSITAANFDIVA